MRFWDSSALVPLVVEEPTSPALESVLAVDTHVATWWASQIECAAAVARKVRSTPGDGARGADSFRHLAEFASGWTEIPPSEQLRNIALRLVRTHPLRAGDALQLAAAIHASENRPETLELVTLDERLADAARREGFTILGLA